MKPRYILLLLAFALFSCAEEKTEVAVTNPEDYNKYLATDNQTTHTNAMAERDFWNNKLSVDTTGVGSLGPLAGAYSTLFETTGNAKNLYKAEELYKKAIENSAHNKDAYVRGLARNYISQHRFKDAETILEKSYNGISNKKATRLMLFDVYMELGKYAEAQEMLEKIKNMSDYNYLIRQAKWNDYKGDLDGAINFLEKARDIADSRKSRPLQLWTYTNLGDYYGHAGRIKDAYNQYIKALNIQPDNAYALKGIAWITYSAEKDTAEAVRILDSISTHHDVPDYLLLRSEMAEFEGDTQASNQYADQFLEKINAGDYGAMYNAYLIEAYASSNPEKALQIANTEVENRATPEAYHLLALAQLKNGDKEKALTTIKNHVKGKTHEPMALYHTALVYKANDMPEAVKPIKEELMEASFELGPIMHKKIQAL
ncbi:tetratricopeptide repeat protein [Marinirhabdus gelatinilytica]|uniref:Tfp pilus assembly protein PilF n=1 Tax=Marinirhabdus gelatinilytica TaxID=1703343 RepID=A0A370QGG9_9FLAO|nr:tetratricopeptide repeat protein [Marinirhabdus gelatinilytica]RDK87150.1 Tfp pilus assembly protein PilF [Marinirhabdus gelatinilytica]